MMKTKRWLVIYTDFTCEEFTNGFSAGLFREWLESQGKTPALIFPNNNGQIPKPVWKRVV